MRCGRRDTRGRREREHTHGHTQQQVKGTARKSMQYAGKSTRLLPSRVRTRAHGTPARLAHGSDSWARRTSEVFAQVGVHPALLPERAVVLQGERDRVGRAQKGRLGDGCHDLLEADWHSTRITHHAPRTTHHASRITHHASRTTHHA